MRASAEATATILRDAGLTDVRLLELDGGHPAVFGQLAGPAGRADGPAVRPPRRAARRRRRRRGTTPPFEPVVAATACTGAAAADDKCGIAIHAAAIRALLADGDAARHDQGRRRGRGGVLDRAPARARARARRPASRRRRGRRRRRQHPHGRADDRHQRPRRDSLTVRVDVLAPGRALRRRSAVRSPTPIIGARADARVAARPTTARWRSSGLHAFAWQGTDVTEEEFRAEAARLLRRCGCSDPARSRIARCRSRRSTSSRSTRPAPTRSRTRSSRRATAVVGPADGSGRGLSRARPRRSPTICAPPRRGACASRSTEDEPGQGYLVDTSSPTFAAAREALQDAFDARGARDRARAARSRSCRCWPRRSRGSRS